MVTKRDNPLQLNGWVTFYHHVSDVERAKRWYIDVMGMEFSHKAGDDLQFLRVSPSIDKLEFDLFKSTKENPKTHAILDFRVNNLEKARERCLALGIQVGEIRQVTETRIDMELIDPDGYPILVHEMVAIHQVSRNDYHDSVSPEVHENHGPRGHLLATCSGSGAIL